MKHLRTLLWSDRGDPSFEYCSLSQTEDGFHFAGEVVMRVEQQPMSARYQIVTDQNWCTKQVDVTLKEGSREEHLVLRVDAEQRWWRGTEEIVECRGSLDVDLSFSPSTNTLAMRRFALGQGESKTTTTAWVQLPDLKVSPFPQQYTRLSPNEYLFTSLMDDFKARLQVDDLGLVMDYEGLWEVIAQAR
jgi:uncharacterized protein